MEGLLCVGTVLVGGNMADNTFLLAFQQLRRKARRNATLYVQSEAHKATASCTKLLDAASSKRWGKMGHLIHE